MKWRLSVGEILELLGAVECRGSREGEVTGIADLRSAGRNDLSFLSGGKYARFLSDSRAGVVIVPEGQAGEPAEGITWILAGDPSLALASICRRIEKLLKPVPDPGVHPTAIIDPAAEIDPAARIGPFCLVGARARIGAGAVLESHVRVEQEAVIGEESLVQHGVVVGWGCQVGKRCRLFAGSVIGADGFGYHSDKTGHSLLPQIGTVVIENDVDVGANSSIDRARFSETRIGQGTKIDNLVQVGHNVIIGKHCILCSGAGIAGSSQLGNFVVLAGQVGVAGHLRIGDGATLTGQSGVTKDVPPGAVLGGTPARPHRDELRKQVLLGQLPEFSRRLAGMEKKLSQI